MPGTLTTGLYVEKPPTPQDNLTLIIALIALIVVAVYFVSTKLRSRPVSSIGALEVNSHQKIQRGRVNPLQVKPKYFGTTEGMIIKAIAVDGMHELSHIKEQVKLPEELCGLFILY